MTEPAQALAKSIAHYATDETASRRLRRVPIFVVPQKGNDALASLLQKLDVQASATTRPSLTKTRRLELQNKSAPVASSFTNPQVIYPGENTFPPPNDITGMRRQCAGTLVLN